MNVQLRVVCFAFAGMFVSTTVNARCPPPDPDDHHVKRTAAHIWRQEAPTQQITFQQLALRAAPILWFSPDEPLLPEAKPNQPITIPEGIPERFKQDPRDAKRVVYYKIREMAVRPCVNSETPALQSLVMAGDDVKDLPVPLDLLEDVFIRFMFYYSQDIGGAPHKHDLESLDLEIGIQKRAVDASLSCSPCYEAVILMASGSAHGIGWFTSTLDGGKADDVLVPLTMLVEEGKHASVPDRNGDGQYTPGYDVTEQVHDAWGVRDTMRAAYIDTAAYRADMTKPRLSADRVFPDRPIGDFTAYRGRRHEDRDAFAKILEINRYDLRVAPHLADFCKGQEVNDAVKGANNEDKELFDLLNEQSYCHELHVRGHYPLQFYKLKEWLKPLWPREQAFEHIGQRFSFAWRIDDGHKKGLSAVLPFGYPAPLGGWLSLKFNINADGEGIKPTTWGTDLVYSPSASRFIDWYVVPVAWDRAFGTNGTSQFAQEAGMRFRFPVLKLPLRFYGGRIGLRNNALLGTSRNTRLVFELGGGSW